MKYITNIKVKFRPSAVEGQPGKLLFALTRHKRKLQLSTNYIIFPHEWDDKCKAIKFGLSKSRAKLLKSISIHLKCDIQRFKHIIAKLEDENTDFSVDEVAAQFIQLSEEQSFIKYMQDVIERLRLLSKDGTADNYQYTLNSFKTFLNGDIIYLEEISSSIIEEYEAWLSANGVKPNSSSFYMRNLRAVYNRAVEDNLTPDCKPFRKVYTGIEKTSKRAITFKEIKRIKELDLSSKPSLQLARDIFMFQFYAMGISFIDAAFLTSDNITGEYIIYRRRKTYQEIVVPMSLHLATLINKYRDADSKFILPIISASSDTPLRIQYKAAIHRINPLLKKLGKLAGISIPLTTYVARHAWASIAKEKGVDIVTISDALGHDNIRTTQIYLSTISHERLSKANDLILCDL